MHWIPGFFNTLILLGALQGFIVSTLLYYSPGTKHPGSQSRRLLAVLIFLLALACLNIFLIKQPWVTSTTAGAVLSALVPLVIVMPVGPLIFFYVRSCIDPGFRVGRKQRIHFFPVIIDLFPHIFALLYIIAILTGIIPRNVYNPGGFIDAYDTYSDIPRWLSLTVYLWLSARYMRAAQTQTVASPQNPLTQTIQWPKKFVRIFAIFGGIWLLFLLPYEIPRYSDALIDTLDWYPIYLPLVFMIYWLGVKGYFIRYRDTHGSPDPEKKAARPTLPAGTADQVALVLRKCMEEDRLWLNPELDLHMLSQHSSIAAKTLSMVLNQHMNTTFNEFVNAYRILEVKNRLLRPESRSLTIAGLAYECGFNSLPTFQRAFKAILGYSPKEFLSKNAAATPPPGK
jgi:AraC-like DNA-binding protein